ncbi:hypothetical protein [Lysobacter sp. TAB13]|uniref:hypothetical protein n=1 Tax=Lysobacter sp. TAB13 TaxID=3233065 RepID=UPI003F9A2E40
MADAGSPARKPGGAPDPSARAPCCGLPSPLASAIRVTVGAHAAPAAPANSGATEVAAKPGKPARA